MSITIKLLTAHFLIGWLLVSGCASPPTKKIEEKIEVIPDGMGLIYIYRPSRMGGAFYYYDVHVEKGKGFPLKNGKCFRYFAKPGEVEVWAEQETKSSVTLDVKSGETYYVRGTLKFGWIESRPYLEVTPHEETSKPEGSRCELLTKTPAAPPKTTEPQ